jgi:hypothetical protein
MQIDLKLQPIKQTIHAQLHESDSECPIMQEPISSAVVDHLPRPFMQSLPTHKAITLECSHTFHAMALVYHWARNSNVLCPVCRAGPKGQTLVIGKLPKEWRYSLGARVRREKKKDRAEEEAHNYHVSIQTSLRLDIRIETLLFPAADIYPTSWTVTTQFIPLQNCFVFDVPPTELSGIPFTSDTIMRLVPYTDTRTLRPSYWFKAGGNALPGPNFGIACDERGFHHIHFSMSHDEFAALLADVFFLANVW